MPLRSLYARAVWPNEWLVFDRPVRVADSASPCGLIQKVGNRYEVTKLDGHCVQYARYSTFDDALASLRIPNLAPVECTDADVLASTEAGVPSDAEAVGAEVVELAG